MKAEATLLQPGPLQGGWADITMEYVHSMH